MIDMSVTRHCGRRTRTRGGIIGWLVMSLLVVCALAVLVGIFFLRTIKVHESGAGNDVRVDTPFGSMHVSHNGNGQSQATGIPMYPGARPMKDRESAVVDFSSGGGGVHIAAGRWETSDPIDKVQKFYEDKFPDMSVIQHDGKVEMHSVSGRAKRVIVLYGRGSSTEISLASVGEPKAN